MLGWIVNRWRARSAARQYALRLGRQIRADYGAGSDYTPAQIRASVGRARLPPDHIHFGYAGFMSEDAFNRLGLPGPPHDYQALRSLLRKYAPPGSVTSGFEPAPENLYANGGAPDISHTSL